MLGQYDDFWRLVTDTTIVDEQDGAYAFSDTVFWGEKGGMPADRGTINGLTVTDLFWQDGKLWHRVEGTLSDPIHMEVDEDTRLTNTAAQSALHLFDGYFRRRGHVMIAVGVHEENQWFEVDRGEFSDEEMADMQEYINQAIRDAVPLSINYVKGKEYPDPSYQQFDTVRIVRYGDLDEQPCGTPHLHNTVEIGSFVLLGQEKTSRGVRVHVAIGPVVGRALKEAHDLLRNLEGTLKVSRKELADRVLAMAETERKQKETIKSLQEALAEAKATMLAKQDDFIVMLSAEEAEILRPIGQKLYSEQKCSKILLAEKQGGSSIVFASCEGKARDWLASVKDVGQVRGGGSPQFVNGQSALVPEELKKILCETVEDVRQ